MHRVLGLALCLLVASCRMGALGDPDPADWPGVPAPEPAPPPKPEPPPPAPAAAADQDLEVTVEGAPQLSGRYWAGDLVCLPPAYRATLKPLAPGAKLLLADAESWKQSGGTVQAAEDGSLELFSPQRFGQKYRLELRGAKETEFPIYVLFEAAVEDNRQTGGWTVSLGKERLGNYPHPAMSRSKLVRAHAESYRPPRFFLKIDETTEKLRLAPHLLAGQMVSFITEKDKTKPKRRHTMWFPPNRPLVEKIERLSLELESQGVKFKRLAINSGFRTPAYNARIGGAGYSRHVYGDAADVMIDEDGDERMDDLTGDKRADERDALVIAQAVRKLELAGRVPPGGIGAYSFDTPDSCAAFVHLDARGFMTRWGTVHRRGRILGLDWWPPEEFKQEEEDGE